MYNPDVTKMWHLWDKNICRYFFSLILLHSQDPDLHSINIQKVRIMQNKKTRKLCFNFKRIHKKEVYQAFLDIYAHGGIELTNQDLITFLARYTNLGSEASIKTLFYRYKQQIHLWVYKSLQVIDTR